MGWIAVDLDGTLAKYPCPINEIGEPIPLMVERVKQWLSEGKEVRIMTARVGNTGLYVANSDMIDSLDFANEQEKMIQDWTEKHIGERLRVTASKDFAMVELWDDRAVRVEFNTGKIL